MLGDQLGLHEKYEVQLGEQPEEIEDLLCRADVAAQWSPSLIVRAVSDPVRGAAPDPGVQSPAGHQGQVRG